MPVGWISEGWTRLAGDVLLASHIFVCLMASDKPVSRDDLLSLTNLISKGTPDEINLVLSWLIDTRRFAISFPDEKNQSWTSQINNVLKCLFFYN